MRNQELTQKFKPVIEKLREFGAEKYSSVDQVIKTQQTYKESIDARFNEITQSDCIIFMPDYKETIESKLEFIEANRLRKAIRLYTKSDMLDIKLTLERTIR